MHILLLLASLLISTSCLGGDISYGVPATSVRFVVLDKTSAKSTEFTLAVGESVRLKSLTIKVVRAWKVIDPSKPDNLAFFEVFEVEGVCKTNLIFSGWISSIYPGCSCLEHARYAIAVLESTP